MASSALADDVGDMKGGTPANPAHARLLRHGLLLEYVTLGWNVVGSGLTLVAAWRAGSVALAGFGLDSLIEIVASLVVVWQLTGAATAGRERKALRLIGAAFLLLASYVLVQSSLTLLTQAHPGVSAGGIAWLALTCAVMLLLAWAKARTGRALGNVVLQTEGRVTLVDAGLAGAVLLGLLLNALVGGMVVGGPARRPGDRLLRHQGRLGSAPSPVTGERRTGCLADTPVTAHDLGDDVQAVGRQQDAALRSSNPARAKNAVASQLTPTGTGRSSVPTNATDTPSDAIMGSAPVATSTPPRRTTARPMMVRPRAASQRWRCAAAASSSSASSRRGAGQPGQGRP